MDEKPHPDYMPSRSHDTLNYLNRNGERAVRTVGMLYAELRLSGPNFPSIRMEKRRLRDLRDLLNDVLGDWE
jgi:hypothetical protein